tara:strand:+ start:279 stop:671 length:393 start_codon:yes stop_codon:yes gene_type:complete
MLVDKLKEMIAYILPTPADQVEEETPMIETDIITEEEVAEEEIPLMDNEVITEEEVAEEERPLMENEVITEEEVAEEDTPMFENVTESLYNRITDQISFGETTTIPDSDDDTIEAIHSSDDITGSDDDTE